MKLLNTIIATALLLLPLTALAGLSGQQDEIKVSGTVTDAAGEPLAGVSVIIEGTMTGVSTGVEGEYSINAAVGQTL